MRPWVQMVVLSMALVAGPLASDAAARASFPAPPPPGRFTSDGAGLIEKEDGQEIDRLAAALLAEKGYPVNVVTIRSLASQDATGYTIEVCRGADAILARGGALPDLRDAAPGRRRGPQGADPARLGVG